MAFNHANNFTIGRLSQTDIHIGVDQGFNLLQKQVTAGAAHNATDRYNAAKCHPETRKAVLSIIMNWVDSEDKSSGVMLLYGPAGAGKSAIAQTIADEYHHKGMLAASFFFSRFRAGLNKKDSLIATIAYQICISIPEAKQYIVAYIEKNPDIFNSNIKTQMEELVFNPLSIVGSDTTPRLIIIDGLDECETTQNDQAQIIEAIVKLLVTRVDNSNLRILLVGRPEVEIRDAVNRNMDRNSLSFRLLALDNTFDPDKDIDLFLRSHFHTLKQYHTLRSTLPASWPSDEAIKMIVKKSSGQFIYASTLVNYVSDPRHDPQRRLHTILENVPPSGENPFSQLDGLYSTILSASKNYSKVAMILEAIMFLNKGHVPVSGDEILASAEYLDAFFFMNSNETLLLLVDLHSIIDVSETGGRALRFYHASLDDFLRDPSRSCQFFIDEYKAHARLAKHCIDNFLNKSPRILPDIVYNYSMGCCFCHLELSNWDDNILDFIRENRLLEDRSQVENALQQYSSNTRAHFASYKSALGHMVDKLYKRHTTKAKVRDLIDFEVLSHVKQYRQDDIFILYHFLTKPEDVEDEFFVNMGQTLEKSLNIEESATMNDIFHGPITKWFIDLMRASEYIYHLGEDDQARSICRMLDIMMSSLPQSSTACLAVFYDIFKHIPASSLIATTVYKKWELMEISAHHEIKASIGHLIGSYRERCQVSGIQLTPNASAPPTREASVNGKGAEDTTTKREKKWPKKLRMLLPK